MKNRPKNVFKDYLRKNDHNDTFCVHCHKQMKPGAYYNFRGMFWFCSEACVDGAREGLKLLEAGK